MKLATEPGFYTYEVEKNRFSQTRKIRQQARNDPGFATLSLSSPDFLYFTLDRIFTMVSEN